jgi:hypothetical protein
MNIEHRTSNKETNNNSPEAIKLLAFLRYKRDELVVKRPFCHSRERGNPEIESIVELDTRIRRSDALGDFSQEHQT